jgi:hypothetical protein
VRLRHGDKEEPAAIDMAFALWMRGHPSRDQGEVRYGSVGGTLVVHHCIATHNMELAARMDRRETLHEGLMVELD